MTNSSSSATRRYRLIRITGIGSGAFLLLLLITYFVVTSGAFFKGVILPGAGRSLNADISVDNASLSPFSNVSMTRLVVKPHGKEVLLRAEEVRVRYRLLDILGGKITVDELTIQSPAITIVKESDGSSNLDPLIANDDKEREKGNPKKDKADEPLQLNIRNVSLKGGSFTQTTIWAGGGRDVILLSNLNLSLDQLANGAVGKLIVSAGARMQNSAPAGSTNTEAATADGTLEGSFDYRLAANGLPDSAKGALALVISQASGALGELQGAARLTCDLTPTEVRELSLGFEKAGERLGELRVSGPFSVADLEGDLKVEVSSVDHRFLNAISAASGLDFNSTRVNSTNQIALAQKGKSLSVRGGFAVSDMSVTRKETRETTPILNLRATYDIAVDQLGKVAKIQSLALDGTQNSTAVLKGSLSRPMSIAWGGAATSSDDAALEMEISGLDLGGWAVFVPELSPSGQANAKIGLMARQGGKQVSLDLTSSLQGFSLTLGSNRISNATLNLSTKAEVSEMKNVALEQITLRVSQSGTEALSMTASGSVNTENKETELKTSIQGNIAPLLEVFVMPGTALKSGSLRFDGALSRSNDAQRVNGSFAVADLIGTNSAPPISARLVIDAVAKSDVYDVKKCQLELSPTARARNELNITGTMDLSKSNHWNGKITIQSEALDLTPFYNLYSGPTNTASSTPTAVSPSSAPDNEEPEAMTLPIGDVLAEIDLKNFYLREIEIKDWRGAVRVQGSRVVLDPFQLSLNGGPVKVAGDLNLGVRGYAYDLSASLNQVPLGPLANTFMPENYGAYQGTLIADTRLKGAGTTGVNLKKTLDGHANFTFTNANIKIVGKYLQPILSGISFVLRAPELKTSPVKWAVASLKFGSGKIEVPNLQIQSDVFAADLKAQIPIADVLTESPLGKIPVNFGLNNSLSRKLLLSTGSAPTDSSYVMMPGFLSLVGTLGEPKPDYNMIKVAGTVLERVGDKIPGLNEKADGILKGIGEAISGKPAVPPTATNSTSKAATNAPATNQFKLDNVLDLFKKKKK